MATTRPRPYSQFNFLVDLGIEGGPHAGFQELSQIKKITGLNKSTDVTMKRGVISSSALQDWLNQIRKAPKRARRTVTVELQDEQNRVANIWTLKNASIIKYDGPPLNAKGTDVAIEELVLSCERIEVKKKPRDDG
jgi:phage tail-like protein